MDCQLINTSVGGINVFIQGNVAKRDSLPVFLTVHDLGRDPSSFDVLTSNPIMSEVMERSIWLHMEVPGQGQKAENWPDNKPFPSLDDLSAACVEIIDHYCVKYVVALGQGAGANILTRMAIANPSRVVGLAAIHPTSTGAGVAEILKDKWMGWKLRNVGHNPTTEQYLVFYHYGHEIEKAEDKEKTVEKYVENMKSNTNPHNLEKFLNSFANRTALASQLKEKLTTETIIITGSKYALLHTNMTFYENCNHARSSLLKVDDVSDVLTQAPDALAKSLILFCKGIGILVSVNIPGVQRRSFSGEEGRGRRPSMAEADNPSLLRSLSNKAMD